MANWYDGLSGGSSLTQDQINQLIQADQNNQVPWGQLGYNSASATPDIIAYAIQNGQLPTQSQVSNNLGWDTTNNPLGQSLTSNQVQDYETLSKSNMFPWEQLGMSGGAGGDVITNAYLQNFGRLPTNQEIAAVPPGPDANAYIASLAAQQKALGGSQGGSGGPSVLQQNEGASLDQAGSAIQGLVNNQMMGNIQNLTNPSSPGYQQFSGNLNNLGITPSSGAFQAGLGATLGSEANSATNAALSEVGLPIINSYSTAQETPYLNSVYQPYNLQGQGYNWQQFQAEQGIANGLNPGSGLSEGQGALQGAGTGAAAGSAFGPWGSLVGAGVGAAGGAASANNGGTSYVCMALIDHGLAKETDLDLLHYRIFPAVFQKARAFWHYAMNGKKLVDACNAKGLDWSKYRERLLDNVVRIKDPIAAVNAYALACKELCMESDPTLWDERVMRTSIIDSLLFLPLIFTYKPFLKALKKVIRLRMMILPVIPSLSRLS